MRFGHPEHLPYVVAVVPLLFLLILALVARFRALELLGEKRLITVLAASQSRARLVWKMILIVLGTAMLLVGFAAPQLGTRLKEVKKKGIDIVIALDVSNSMLAEDIKPSRLSKAKYEISKLIDKLGQDRIGLVAFAGDAFLQCPMTLDKSALKLFLDAVSTDAIQTQGTNFRAAIEESASAFRGIEGAAAASDRNITRNRVVLLLSDGEDFEKGIDAAVDEAIAQKIRVFTIGVGTEQPTPIPVFNERGMRIDFKRDENGIVTTKFVETDLRRIADKTGGSYYHLDAQTTNLDGIVSELERLQKTELASREFLDYDDKFQIFLSIGLFLLMLETLVGDWRKLNP